MSKDHVNPADLGWTDDLVTHNYASLPGVRLHYVEAGRGPLVVLLHGFPQFWYCWRYQIPALAGAGFRAIAPDMRGYNLSDKPRGVRAYRDELLTADLANLIRSCGDERAAVVGHDWGAVVALWFAMRHPEMLDRLAIINGPHPARYLELLLNWRQLLRSWYVFFFGLPMVPEALLSRLDVPALGRVLQWDAVESIDADDLRAYKQALDRPGALTSALNYYRAALRRDPRRSIKEGRPVEAPVLIMWGERDRSMIADQADVDAKWAPHLRVERLPLAGHWLPEERPQEVNDLLLDFLP